MTEFILRLLYKWFPRERKVITETLTVEYWDWKTSPAEKPSIGAVPMSGRRFNYKYKTYNVMDTVNWRIVSKIYNDLRLRYGYKLPTHCQDAISDALRINYNGVLILNAWTFQLQLTINSMEIKQPADWSPYQY